MHAEVFQGKGTEFHLKCIVKWALVNGDIALVNGDLVNGDIGLCVRKTSAYCKDLAQPNK